MAHTFSAIFCKNLANGFNREGVRPTLLLVALTDINMDIMHIPSSPRLSVHLYGIKGDWGDIINENNWDSEVG